MKIPDKIKFGGLTFEVQEKETLNFGEFDGFSQTIKLSPGQKQDQKEETLVHEILHGCIRQSGLRQRLNDTKNDVTEEQIVNAISPMLHAVLKDNKLTFHNEADDHGK